MKNLLHKLRIISEGLGEKNYLDDEIGLLYTPAKELLYIGSNKDSTLNYTLTDVQGPEVEEIVKSLKGIDPKEWLGLLKSSGFNVLRGGAYFELEKQG